MSKVVGVGMAIALALMMGVAPADAQPSGGRKGVGATAKCKFGSHVQCMKMCTKAAAAGKGIAGTCNMRCTNQGCT
jgi:hypothetical protein